MTTAVTATTTTTTTTVVEFTTLFYYFSAKLLFVPCKRSQNERFFTPFFFFCGCCSYCCVCAMHTRDMSVCHSIFRFHLAQLIQWYSIVQSFSDSLIGFIWRRVFASGKIKKKMSFWVTEWVSERVREEKNFRSKTHTIFICDSIHNEKASNFVHLCNISQRNCIFFVCVWYAPKISWNSNFNWTKLMLSDFQLMREQSASTYTHTHTHAIHVCRLTAVGWRRWRLRNLSVSPSLVWQLSLPIEISCRCAFYSLMIKVNNLPFWEATQFFFCPDQFYLPLTTHRLPISSESQFYLFIHHRVCAGGSPLLTSCCALRRFFSSINLIVLRTCVCVCCAWAFHSAQKPRLVSLQIVSNHDLFVIGMCEKEWD